MSWILNFVLKWLRLRRAHQVWRVTKKGAFLEFLRTIPIMPSKGAFLVVPSFSERKLLELTGVGSHNVQFAEEADRNSAKGPYWIEPAKKGSRTASLTEVLCMIMQMERPNHPLEHGYMSVQRRVSCGPSTAVICWCLGIPARILLDTNSGWMVVRSYIGTAPDGSLVYLK